MWQRISAYLFLTTVFLTQPIFAIAQETTKPTAPQQTPWPHGHDHWHMWGGHSGWHFWWSPLIMIIFFVLLFSAMRHWGYDRRWHMRRGSQRDPTHSAIEILHERFAKGEIEEAEYKDKKAKILAT